MKLNELVAAAKADRPKVFAGLDDKRVARLAQALLAQTGRFLAEAKDGKHQVEGLGRVVVKQVEVTKNGAKVQRKRIVIRPKVRKAKAGKKAGAKGAGQGAGKGAGKRAGKAGGKAAAKALRRQARAAKKGAAAG